MLLEANPTLTIEHMENKTTIPFSRDQQQELMAELNALPVSQPKSDVIYFKDIVPKESKTVINTESESKIQRWIRLDQAVSNKEEISTTDQDFWELFQTAKKFGELAEDDAELNAYLAQRQG